LGPSTNQCRGSSDCDPGFEAEELKRIAEEKALVRRREEGSAQSLSDLLALEKQRGYRPGWARARYAARQRRAGSRHA
jgi:hypothetical protein